MIPNPKRSKGFVRRALAGLLHRLRLLPENARDVDAVLRMPELQPVRRAIRRGDWQLLQAWERAAERERNRLWVQRWLAQGGARS